MQRSTIQTTATGGPPSGCCCTASHTTLDSSHNVEQTRAVPIALPKSTTWHLSEHPIEWSQRYMTVISQLTVSSCSACLCAGFVERMIHNAVTIQFRWYTQPHDALCHRARALVAVCVLIASICGMWCGLVAHLQKLQTECMIGLKARKHMNILKVHDRTERVQSCQLCNHADCVCIAAVASLLQCQHQFEP